MEKPSATRPEGFDALVVVTVTPEILTTDWLLALWARIEHAPTLLRAGDVLYAEMPRQRPGARLRPGARRPPGRAVRGVGARTSGPLDAMLGRAEAPRAAAPPGASAASPARPAPWAAAGRGAAPSAAGRPRGDGAPTSSSGPMS